MPINRTLQKQRKAIRVFVFIRRSFYMNVCLVLPIANIIRVYDPSCGVFSLSTCLHSTNSARWSLRDSKRQYWHACGRVGVTDQACGALHFWWVSAEEQLEAGFMFAKYSDASWATLAKCCIGFHHSVTAGFVHRITWPLRDAVVRSTHDTVDSANQKE